MAVWAAFLAFIAFLLFAVQVLLNLRATSVLSAVGYDAARRVAAAGGEPAARDAAEADARRALGRYGASVRFEWNLADPDVVVLHVLGHNPTLALPGLAGPTAFADVDRTIRVRVERFR